MPNLWTRFLKAKLQVLNTHGNDAANRPIDDWGHEWRNKIGSDHVCPGSAQLLVACPGIELGAAHGGVARFSTGRVWNRRRSAERRPYPSRKSIVSRASNRADQTCETDEPACPVGHYGFPSRPTHADCHAQTSCACLGAAARANMGFLLRTLWATPVAIRSMAAQRRSHRSRLLSSGLSRHWAGETGSQRRRLFVTCARDLGRLPTGEGFGSNDLGAS
jgi:hypothetical protein